MSKHIKMTIVFWYWLVLYENTWLIIGTAAYNISTSNYTNTWLNIFNLESLGPILISSCCVTNYQSHDHLIFIMETPVPEKMVSILKLEPGCSYRVEVHYCLTDEELPWLQGKIRSGEQNLLAIISGRLVSYFLWHCITPRRNSYCSHRAM